MQACVNGGECMRRMPVCRPLSPRYDGIEACRDDSSAADEMNACGAAASVCDTDKVGEAGSAAGETHEQSNATGCHKTPNVPKASVHTNATVDSTRGYMARTHARTHTQAQTPRLQAAACMQRLLPRQQRSLHTVEWPLCLHIAHAHICMQPCVHSHAAYTYTPASSTVS